MNVLEKLEKRIKELKLLPLGFLPAKPDECDLLELAAARIKELEEDVKEARRLPEPGGIVAYGAMKLGKRDLP